MVLDPNTILDESIETWVPATTMPCPPLDSVVPAIARADVSETVIVFPAIVIMGNSSTLSGSVVTPALIEDDACELAASEPLVVVLWALTVGTGIGPPKALRIIAPSPDCSGWSLRLPCITEAPGEVDRAIEPEAPDFES